MNRQWKTVISFEAAATANCITRSDKQQPTLCSRCGAGEWKRIWLVPYSFSLRGDLCAFVHSFNPRRIRRSRPEVSFQLLHLRLQRASAGLALHLVHVHVQLVALLLGTLCTQISIWHIPQETETGICKYSRQERNTQISNDSYECLEFSTSTCLCYLFSLWA